jgi:hypothetical protein
MKESNVLKGAIIPIVLTMVLVLGVIVGTFFNPFVSAENRDGERILPFIPAGDMIISTAEERELRSLNCAGGMFPTNRNSTENRLLAEQRFSVNENGQTYGSSMGLPLEQHPDLISVMASRGSDGYVYFEDTNHEGLIFTLEELRRLNEQGIFYIAVPVYAYDGVTIVGEYRITLDAGNVIME